MVRLLDPLGAVFQPSNSSDQYIFDPAHFPQRLERDCGSRYDVGNAPLALVG